MSDWQFGVTIKQERWSCITVRVTAETEAEARRMAVKAAEDCDSVEMEGFAKDGERWWDDGEITVEGIEPDEFPIGVYGADVTVPPVEAGSAEDMAVKEAAGQMRLPEGEGER